MTIDKAVLNDILALWSDTYETDVDRAEKCMTSIRNTFAYSNVGIGSFKVNGQVWEFALSENHAYMEARRRLKVALIAAQSQLEQTGSLMGAAAAMFAVEDLVAFLIIKPGEFDYMVEALVEDEMEAEAYETDEAKNEAYDGYKLDWESRLQNNPAKAVADHKGWGWDTIFDMQYLTFDVGGAAIYYLDAFGWEDVLLADAGNPQDKPFHTSVTYSGVICWRAKK